MKLFNLLNEQIKGKSIVIIVIAIIFFIISVLFSLIGFEMFVYEDQLLKENFVNTEALFYLLFVAVNGISFFFFYLSKGLWKLKEWTRFFILGSSFLSLLYVIYNITTLTYFIIFKEVKNEDENLYLLVFNFLSSLTYISLLKYFTLSRIELLFNKEEEEKNEITSDNFYTLKK